MGQYSRDLRELTGAERCPTDEVGARPNRSATVVPMRQLVAPLAVPRRPFGGPFPILGETMTASVLRSRLCWRLAVARPRRHPQQSNRFSGPLVSYTPVAAMKALKLHGNHDI